MDLVKYMITYIFLMKNVCKFDVVSGMAEWLRWLLAKWKVLGSNLTMEKVSEKFRLKKTKQKKASYPLLA